MGNKDVNLDSYCNLKDKNELKTSLESPTSQYTKAFSDNNNDNDKIGSKSSKNKDKLTGDEDNNAAKKASILEDLKSTSRTPPVGREGKKLTLAEPVD